MPITVSLTIVLLLLQITHSSLINDDFSRCRSVVDYSAFEEEQEVLLSPNSKFIVTSPSTLIDGYYYVDLLEKSEEMVIY